MRRARGATSVGRVGDVAPFDARLRAGGDAGERAGTLRTTRLMRNGGAVRRELFRPARGDVERWGLDVARCESGGVVWIARGEGERGARVERREAGDAVAGLAAETGGLGARAVDVACGRGNESGVAVGVRVVDGAALVRAWVDGGGNEVETRVAARATWRADEGGSLAMNPTLDFECAAVSGSGDLVVLNEGGARQLPGTWAVERLSTADERRRMGVAYGNHPRALLHAVSVPGSGTASRVYSVDLRAHRGETRIAHEADAGDSIVAVSSASENYYAVGTSSSSGAFVELRDLRRARDPVARWAHLGVSAPSIVRIFDADAWRKRPGPGRRHGICAYSLDEREVYMYECHQVVGARRVHSGDVLDALSHGTSVHIPCTGLRGFSMSRFGPERGELFWMDRGGEWSQSYFLGDDDLSASPLLFESPVRNDGFMEGYKPLVQTARTSRTEVATDGSGGGFTFVPHVYEFIAHGKVPTKIELPSRTQNASDDALKNCAILHAAFTDGWRLNTSELLECGEYLHADASASASLSLSDWRHGRGRKAARMGNVRRYHKEAEERPENPLSAERSYPEHEERFREWMETLVDARVPDDLAAALEDYASGAENGFTKFSRRMYHAVNCLKDLDSTRMEAAIRKSSAVQHGEDDDYNDGYTPSMAPFASADPLAYSQNEDFGQNDSFMTRLLASWRPERGR